MKKESKSRYLTKKDLPAELELTEKLKAIPKPTNNSMVNVNTTLRQQAEKTFIEQEETKRGLKEVKEDRNEGETSVLNEINPESLKKEIEILKVNLGSLNQLMWILIINILFSAIQGTASQKYIQYVLQGEASDLASVNSFKSLATLTAPFFGTLMDKVYPFGLRLGPYLILTECIQIACMYLIGTTPVSKSQFIVLLTIHNCGSILTGAITQAVIAIKTKKDIELKEKKKTLRRELDRRTTILRDSDTEEVSEDSDKIGMDIYATFSLFSMICGGLSSMVAGLLVDNLRTKTVFLAAMVPNIVLLLFTLIMFKESKEPSSFPPTSHSGSAFTVLKQITQTPALLLPLLAVMLASLAPNSGEVINFISISVVGWSYTQRGEVFTAKAVIVAVILMQVKKFNKSISFENMILIGIISTACGRFAEVHQAIPVFLGAPYVASFLINGINFEIYAFFTAVPLYGRLNSMIPKGLEGSGANTLKALLALVTTGCASISATELEVFDVKGGYYGRVQGPLLINATYCVLLVLVTPFLLLGGMKKRKKKGVRKTLKKLKEKQMGELEE